MKLPSIAFTYDAEFGWNVTYGDDLREDVRVTRDEVTKALEAWMDRVELESNAVWWVNPKEGCAYRALQTRSGVTMLFVPLNTDGSFDPTEAGEVDPAAFSRIETYRSILRLAAAMLDVQEANLAQDRYDREPTDDRDAQFDRDAVDAAFRANDQGR